MAGAGGGSDHSRFLQVQHHQDSHRIRRKLNLCDAPGDENLDDAASAGTRLLILPAGGRRESMSC